MRDVNRREVLGGITAIASTSLLPSSSSAALQGGRNRSATATPRAEFIIRHAYMMTMDPELGDLPDSAIHVKNGEIVAIQRDVQVQGVQTFDGSDMIVMPGLIDTHWHMWNTLFRSFAGDKPVDGYFPTVARFGQSMVPEDMFQATRLAAAEAINSGITTVHNWCHNARSRAHAEEDIRALSYAGLRGRFSCGWPQGLPDNQMTDLTIIEGLHHDWKGFSNDGMLTLGMGWRGQVRAGPVPEAIYRPEFAKARELGIPISVHVGTKHSATGQVGTLIKDGLVGKDVQLVHALSSTPEEILMIKDVGATVSVSPLSELRIGNGFPLTSEFLKAGIPLGVSVDSVVLSGSANLFEMLKVARSVVNARAENEFELTAKQALEIGTIGGAKSLGVDHLVGSLRPGKRADLIMISTKGLNMGVFTDASHMALECTQPENIDTVVVDGRVLKRNGELTALRPAVIVRESREALKGIRARANWR
jgi:cytosine/adenosine deaminase-related metal-dependent hydrolase